MTETSTKVTGNLDIIPKEVFFIHDIKFGSKKKVQFDEHNHGDGYFIEAEAICGASLLAYTTGGKYKGKVSLHEIQPDKKDPDVEKTIRVTVEPCEFTTDKAIKKHLEHLNGLDHDQIRAKMLHFGNMFASNEGEDRQEEQRSLFFALNDPEVEGFTVVDIDNFVYTIGKGERVIELIKQLEVSRKPWKLVTSMLENKI